MAGPRQISADEAATPALDIEGARVLVVEARFYDTLADELLAGATAVLEKAGCRVDVVTVPARSKFPPPSSSACVPRTSRSTPTRRWWPSAP